VATFQVITSGRFWVITEAEAKEREYRAEQRKAELSLENVSRRWWVWWAAGKSVRHADYVLRRLEADVFPAFGYKFIESVTAADVQELTLAIESRGARDVASLRIGPSMFIGGNYSRSG
jgi:hypothetical protein